MSVFFTRTGKGTFGILTRCHFSSGASEHPFSASEFLALALRTGHGATLDAQRVGLRVCEEGGGAHSYARRMRHVGSDPYVRGSQAPSGGVIVETFGLALVACTARGVPECMSSCASSLRERAWRLRNVLRQSGCC